MKRLALLLVAMFATTVMAQGRDFNGTWLLDVEKSGTKNGPPQMTIAMTAKDFKLTMGSGERAQTIAMKTDGTESPDGRGATVKGEWKGDKFVAMLITERPATITFSREGEWLVQEGTSSRGPVKLYFKKAPKK